MGLSMGIVGLPNVGKSTLFNALLKKQIADASNYPFCTIAPNKGVIEVPDERLKVIADMIKVEKIVPAVVEFVDIAGLVKGASKGEGLGNQFLANIREVNAICHVIRLFEDKSVTHVGAEMNPEKDAELVNTELIMADLQTLEKKEPPKGRISKEENLLWEAVCILKSELEKGNMAIDVELKAEQQHEVKKLCLLTSKPIIYVANIGEDQLLKKDELGKKIKLKPLIVLCAKLESELVAFNSEDQKEYLRQYGLDENGLNKLIKTAYDTLGLISFLTTGEKETRAWTIEKGMKAREAAGVIHSDFIKNFIKAAVISYDEFLRLGGWAAARAQGKIRFEGADYVIQEGDVVEFMVR